MHKVITIDLRGQLYRLAEPGYNALRAYLEQADAQLAANPDRTEIVRDLEQSIAEKFSKSVGSSTTIIAPGEVDQVLAEIGYIDGEVLHADGTATGGSKLPPRRLYQIREGAMLSGVCNGIAAYFNVDPTFARLAFLVAAVSEIAYLDQPPVLTVGLYVVLMFLVPSATTLSERAAAYGVIQSIRHKVQRGIERVKAMFGGLHHTTR